MDGLFHGKSENKMDDFFGVPLFQEPPYGNVGVMIDSDGYYYY